jgi:hypothetical protein
MVRHDTPRRLTLPAALALLLTVALRAPAQERQVLDDASATDTISTRTLLQLSFVGLDVAPGVLAHVFRLPGGGWGVSARTFPGLIQRFDADGTPAGTFGRAGHGPGELGGDIFAVAMRGELWIVDPQNARLSIFSKDLHLAGDRRLDVRAYSVAPARDSASVLVSGTAYVGGTYYRVARVSRKAGADVVGDPLAQHPGPRSGLLVRRRIAAATASGEVWAVAMSGGAVDVLRSRDLAVVARLQLPGEELARQAAWVPDLNERPAPQVAGITADSAGLLWVSIAVADPAWTRGMDPREDIEKYYDTRVLAIDPARRMVVGSIRLDPVCMPVEHRLISCVDELGQTIRVVALQLEHR